MDKIDLSVIIPSYNTKSVILDCLNSIIEYTKGITYEVIVIDNGSKDGSVEELEKYAEKHKQIVFINAKENLGFGKANNLGVKKSKGEYLLFLNSDTLLTDNALERSVEAMRKDKNLGIFSCRLLNSDRSIQPSGGHFPTLFNLIAWQLFIDDLPIVGSLIPSFHPKQSAYDKDQKIDWITGAFMMIPKKIFDQAGGFDENIFMYTEEMELAFRIHRLGFDTYYAKQPSIIHLGGASGGSYLALTSEIKNMIYFWQKHMPAWQLPIVKGAFFVGSLLRWLLFGIIKGDETSRRTYSAALKFII